MIKKVQQQFFTLALFSWLFVTGLTAEAADVMPDFTGAPTGWTTDRYQPNSFSDIGTYNGYDHVLGIGIDAAQGVGTRGAQDGTFYSTQGMKHSVSGGVGDSLSAALYIPSSWANEANGSRRTGMWGVMTDGGGVSGYPIIGFTNEGGVARYRVWEDTVGTWTDLGSSVAYDQWTVFSILFTGSTYEFFIDGALVFTDNTTEGSTGFQDVIMQAWNYNGVGGTVYDNGLGNYTAYWANVSAVPLPAAGLLFGPALLGLLGLRRYVRTDKSEIVSA